MIVAFSGWRGWTDATFVHRQIDQLWGGHTMFGAREVPLHVRVGDARGLDAIVRTYIAGTDGAQLTVYEADWEREGKSAGGHRNRRMLLGDDAFDPSPGRPADLLVAFPEPGRVWSAKGSGTWNAIGQAHYRGIEVRIPAYTASAEVLAADEPLLLFAGIKTVGGES
jgi:hypothetical protein